MFSQDFNVRTFYRNLLGMTEDTVSIVLGMTEDTVCNIAHTVSIVLGMTEVTVSIVLDMTECM